MRLSNANASNPLSSYESDNIFSKAQDHPLGLIGEAAYSDEEIAI